MAERLSPAVSSGFFGGTTAASLSGNFTTPADPVPNACVVIRIMWGDGAATGASVQSVTVTPNAGAPIAATHVVTAGTPGTDTHCVSIYRLTGTFAVNTLHTVDITLNAAGECWGHAELIQDVDQSSPVRDSGGQRNGNLGVAAAVSATPSCETGDLGLCCAIANLTQILTDTGDQTDYLTSTTSDARNIGEVTGSPSVNVSYTNDSVANTQASMAVAIFRNAAAAVPIPIAWIQAA